MNRRSFKNILIIILSSIVFITSCKVSGYSDGAIEELCVSQPGWRQGPDYHLVQVYCACVSRTSDTLLNYKSGPVEPYGEMAKGLFAAVWDRDQGQSYVDSAIQEYGEEPVIVFVERYHYLIQSCRFRSTHLQRWPLYDATAHWVDPYLKVRYNYIARRGHILIDKYY